LDFQLVTDVEIEWEIRQAKKRLAQGLFRANVLEAYGKKCAVTGTSSMEVLDAAHIQPFMSLASHHIQNGVALRKDIHALFDGGLLGLDDAYSVMVSPCLGDPTYRGLAGRSLSLPADARSRPSLEALRRHRQSVFRSTPASSA
jgi:putative restriction endonuclease